MLEAFYAGLTTNLQPAMLLVIFLTVLIGIVVGILPGLGALTAMALLLPFIWGMRADLAIAGLIALNVATFAAGAVTSILLNIPGEPSSVCTLLDGFPMNQKGEGARAIGAAVMSSMVGGVLAVFFAFAMLPFVVPVVLNFKSPEVFFIVILGISFIATLTTKSIKKGIIAGALGILLSTVGLQANTGIPRFTFGSTYLYGTISLPVFIIGFFGIPEMMDILVNRQSSISQAVAKRVTLGDTLGGAAEVFRHWWLTLKCAVIGYIIGVIPGIGAGLAVFVAYGQAKQTSKYPEKFGTGIIEGVIAPQSAENGTSAGSLLTTLAFGIPGSSSGAILLGAFMLVGLVPGPILVEQNLSMIFTLLTGVAIANIIAGAICLGTAAYMGRIAFIHADYIFPTIMSLIFVAAFVSQGTMLDLIMVICAGLLGYVMDVFDYSRAALTLGFVLGELFEYYLFLSLKVYGVFFFARPISLAIIAITIGIFLYRYIASRSKQAHVIIDED